MTNERAKMSISTKSNAAERTRFPQSRFEKLETTEGADHSLQVDHVVMRFLLRKSGYSIFSSPRRTES